VSRISNAGSKAHVDPALPLAVARAVDVVNSHAGQTTVRLRFEGEPYDLDFVANAARLQNGRFEFQAGIETYAGSVEELAEIKTEIIGH